MGFECDKDYTIRQSPADRSIRFPNKSVIQFIGMNQSRDREWSKLKISATMAGIDEVDAVNMSGYNTLTSRTGRKNETGAPRVIISCCNPCDNWVKEYIYIPWQKREGTLPPDLDREDIIPLDSKIEVIQFEIDDSPLKKTGYYDRFYTMPMQWQQRYLFNNWHYIDDEEALFKARTIETLTIDKLDNNAEKYLGVDPNAGGKDRAAITLWQGDTVAKCYIYSASALDRLAEYI